MKFKIRKFVTEDFVSFQKLSLPGHKNLFSNLDINKMLVLVMEKKWLDPIVLV